MRRCEARDGPQTKRPLACTSIRMAFERLAVRPAVKPMLARLVREIPSGDYAYEPKWDGFRALVFRDGDEVEIQSRHGRPFARYFPEIVAAIGQLQDDRVVLDGEIVVVRDGRFDFEHLMLRTHPAASRVAQLAADAPASFIAFDILAIGDAGLMDAPFLRRREQLEAAFADKPDDVRLTPMTDDPAIARGWLGRFVSGAADGVVAKHHALAYEPGKRAMLKVKVERTADCVVAGFRLFPGRLVASLLLGLHDETGALRHVGVCAAFSATRRRELYERLAGRSMPLDAHPWRDGFGLEASPLGRLKGSAGRWHPGMTMDWVPIEPLVAEVAYDTVDAGRFRHPAQFRRWRPDREPQSCTFGQLPSPDNASVARELDLR